MATVYLIDASIYVFRAWFSIPDTLVNDQGHPVNAVRGFFDFTVKFLHEVQPEYIAFVFDESLEHSHRNEIYPPYKENREPAPLELKRQFGQCRQLIRALGICEMGNNRYEADDLIGSMAARGKADGHQNVIVSSDKDLAQLVQGDDIWWDYLKGRKLGIQGVAEHFGVLPDQIADWLALAGDAIDNIPGVPGIGQVTAKKLLQHFGTLDKLLDNLDQIETIKNLRGAGRFAGLISEHIETIRLSRQLTEVYCDVPISESLSIHIGAADRNEFAQLSLAVGFSQYYQKRFDECVQGLASR